MGLHPSSSVLHIRTVLLSCMLLLVAPMKSQHAYAGLYSGGDVSDRMGSNNAAVSEFLVGNGVNCGDCLEVRCVDKPEKCRGGSVVVCITEIIPSNTSLLLLPKLVLERLGYYDDNHQQELLAVELERKPCTGDPQFQMLGPSDFTRVLISNFELGGNSTSVFIKGSGASDWQTMTRDCRSWEAKSNLTGQWLSFKVSYGDNRTMICKDLFPPGWHSGDTYTGLDKCRWASGPI